ncbi:SBBP repeat-containing protein, partial [Tabrizicola sp.]|uniref:DUF7948 domain-containing protein n=1 Tax=Tabrizicola sp. TaxID=2005166 RepID=UPI00286D58CF
SQQNQKANRIEDRKPYKRWEWAYRQRAYPGNEIPEHAIERAEQQLRQWKARMQKFPLQAATGRWVNLGPAPIMGGQTAIDNQTRPVSGRVTDVAVDPTNANHWLIGAAQGGVWETRDAGTTWTPLTDEQESLAIGAVAFAPSNPQIIYAGTGEAPLGGIPYAGLGLLKSIDGGKTWQLLAQTDFAGICFSDIKVDPKNPLIVVAAVAQGPTGFGATKPLAPVGGVFKSTNGGVSWNRSLGLNSWATDLETDPSDFNRQYAALGLNGGSTNNGIYRSENAGSGWALVNGPTATWTTKAGGVGRVELAIAPSNPNILYVSIHDAANSTPNDNQLLGIWRTENAWDPVPVWQELNTDAIRAGEPRDAAGNPRGQFNYDHEIIVDPANPNTLYVGGIGLYKTSNTQADPIVWEQVDNKPDNALHVDQHTMAWALPPQTQQTAVNSLDKLPMSFEPNQGQAAAAVQFQSRGSGYHLQLRATEAVLQLQKSQSAIRNPQSSILKMKLVGASKSPRITGQHELPGKSNYLVGNDPQKWRTGIPNYATVRYHDVWPGIDLAYYGNQQQLEYDFIVAPGVSPKQIKLGFRGARKLRLKRNGELVLRAGSGQVRMHKPLIYQERDGVRKQIRGRFARRGKRQIGFQVAAYDHSLPLVIDPVLSYSTYLGGGLTDRGRGVAVDSNGKIYLAGETFSTDFPRTVGPSGLKGGLDVFVTKIDPAKTGAESLVYSTYIGGSNGDEARDIAVDSSGRAYVGGNTQSSDFPTAGPADPYKGGADAFVLRLNAAGSALEYSTYLGNISDELLSGLALDLAGNAYVTGTLSGAVGFPSTVALGFGIPNRADCFITKFNAAGARVYSAVVFSKTHQIVFRDIAVDSAGNAYVTGYATMPFFPDSQRVGPVDEQSSTVLVAKLNAAGTALGYFTFLGGTAGASGAGQAIAVDATGNAYVTGRTSSTNFPVVNPAQTTLAGQGDAFVAKFNAAGNALLYATYLGGSGLEGVDGSGAG